MTIGTSALNCYTFVRMCYFVSCYAVAASAIATEADFAHFAHFFERFTLCAPVCSELPLLFADILLLGSDCILFLAELMKR